MFKMSSMKSVYFRTGKLNGFVRLIIYGFRAQCDTINAKTIHGYSNFIYNDGQFDAEEAKNRDRWLSESYKLCMSEEVSFLLRPSEDI